MFSIKPLKSGSRPEIVFPSFLLILAIVVSLAGILSQSGQVMDHPMDQAFVTRADLRLYHDQQGWVFQYPRLKWSGGVTASLLIGVYKLLISPAQETLNWHAKGLASIAFLVSSFYLASVCVNQRLLRSLAFLVIASSALQFAEPSSDIFAASFFAFFLVSIQVGWPKFISSGLLVFFGLCKIQLVLASLAVGVFWYAWDVRKSGERLKIPLSLLFWFFILLAPGFKLYGLDMIKTVKGLRTFVTSYMALFGKHQYLGASGAVVPSSLGYQDVLEHIFPGAQTISDVMLLHTRKYVEFLLVSMVMSVMTFLQAMGLMPVPFFLAIREKLFSSSSKLCLDLSLIVAIFALLPPMLLRFLSPRYLAVVLIPLVVLSAAAASSDKASILLRNSFIFCALVTIVLNISFFHIRLVQSPYMIWG